jgi:LytS/YehU family sensor histidine kinase
MLLMGLAAYFFYRSNKQQKLANNLLALKSLRSQMNPHFIFNALNSVNNFIAKSDERSANRYLSDFSTLMRSVLENSDEDFIPLSKELELLELYTKLEHSRFSDKFDYQIMVDDHIDIDAFQIPPMLLQPYIENAIWHGLRYREDRGYLKIEIKQKDKQALEISITDNGIGRKKSAEIKTQNQKKQKSKGMGNIKKRIEILNDMYKDKVAVVISDLDSNGTGTKVVFSIRRDL